MLRRAIHYHTKSRCQHVKPPHPWHPTKTMKGSVALLVVVMLITILGGRGWAIAEVKSVEASTHAQYYYEAQHDRETAEKENYTLRERLNDTLAAVFTKPGKTEWEDFVDQAKAISAVYDYPPNVMISMAALESARGKSRMATERKNYFGYKCFDGREDEMCAYFSTPAESMIEYARLIKYSPRYAKAYEYRHNPELMIEEIRNAGYATDPSYVQKVKSMPEWGER